MNTTESANYIWEHKYRPKTLKGMILPADYMNFFQKIVDDNAGVNLLLESSTPGTGKTSISEALANDLGCSFLKINASSESGIDVIRGKVTRFAETMGFNGAPKMILLDEADRLSMDAQQSLRGIIDDYSDNCRFIMTCNYLNKIIPALRGEEGGRTITLKFDMTKPEYKEELIPRIVARACNILKKENIEYDENAVKELVDLKYPSIRTVIAKLQGYSMMKGKIDADIVKHAKITDELATNILNKNLTESMRIIHENALDYTEVFSFMKTEVIPKLKKQGDGYLNLSEYNYRAAFSADTDIEIIACIVSMIKCM